MTNELLPCPFCGAGTTEVQEHAIWQGAKYAEPISVSVVHWCEPVEGQPSRMIQKVGRDRASAIAAWNRRSPAPGAAELLKRWQDAALDHYTPGWAFDPTNPELMIGNIAREAHPAPGAAAMRKAIALLRSASQQSHEAHFDKTGGSGTGCPECIRARELREKADAILRDIPTQKEAK